MTSHGLRTVHKKMLKTYAVVEGTENSDEGKALHGRTRLLADVGSHALRVGGLLETEKSQSSADLLPEKRDQIVMTASKNVFFHAEARFADNMLKANAFTNATLPKQLCFAKLK